MSALPVPPRAGVVRFFIDAISSPCLLPRVLQPFAKRDVTPEQMFVTREGETMRVEIVLHDPDPSQVPLIVGNLGQLIGVREVRQGDQTGRRAA